MMTFYTCYIYRVVCILNNLNELNSVYIRFYQITNFTGETSGFLREKLDYGPVVIFIITLFSEIRSSFDLLRNKKFPSPECTSNNALMLGQYISCLHHMLIFL